MSVNIIEGPGPSSVATRVIGTGLLEKWGFEVCRESEGRSERAEDGRLLCAGSTLRFSGSVRDARDDGLFPALAALSEEGRLELPPVAWLEFSGLLFSCLLSHAAKVSVSSLDGLAASTFLGIRSGIRISFSPVDFFEGGGPGIVSP